MKTIQKKQTKKVSTTIPKLKTSQAKLAPAARPAKQPKPPYAKQHLVAPGLESKLSPQPSYKAEAYKAAGKLAGKVALITGGDSGIGRAVALLYAREGASVAISYLKSEEADAKITKSEIEKVGGRCIQIPGDLTDPKFCSKLVDQTVKKLGGLDILVSNAAHQTHKRLENLTDKELELTFSTNIYAYFRLARSALKYT